MNDLSARRRLTALAAALLLGACAGNPVVGGRPDAGADAADAGS